MENRDASYEYLRALVNTHQELSRKHSEFATYVQHRLKEILKDEVPSPIAYVTPVDAATIPAPWQSFFKLFPCLIELHMEEGHASDHDLYFDSRLIYPFGVIDGTLPVGIFYGMRSLYEVYLRTAMEESFPDYLRYLGFPLDKLHKSV